MIENPQLYLTGGMYLDGDNRILGSTEGTGELEVKVKDGKLLSSKILTSDEMLFPERTDKEQLDFIKEQVIEKLNG